jgi:hypothetical protein
MSSFVSRKTHENSIAHTFFLFEERALHAKGKKFTAPLRFYTLKL